jgi:hypothetical protein
MRRKSQDRHLGPPAEANRDKHINFVALENKNIDPVNDDVADERSAPRKINKHQPANFKRQNNRRGR